VNADTFGLLLRLVLSLAAVVGLMWLAARLVRGQIGGAGGAVLEVIARQQVGRGASVAVVRVADQAIVVGITESKVNLIAQTDLAAVEAAQARADAERGVVREPLDGTSTQNFVGVSQAAREAGPTRPSGGLQGSIVSPSTWRQAVNVVRDRTARKG
jgi:flagellar protein FliO/FliZ